MKGAEGEETEHRRCEETEVNEPVNCNDCPGSDDFTSISKGGDSRETWLLGEVCTVPSHQSSASGNSHRSLLAVTCDYSH